MQLFLRGLGFSALAVVFVGCSSGSSSGGSTAAQLNPLSASVSQAKSNLAKAQVFSSTAGFTSDIKTLAANADWTATRIADLGGENCGTTTNAKDYMSAMSSSTCTVSVFFDLSNMLDMICVLTNELVLTDGMPDVLASTSVTISSATATACGVAEASGFSMPVEVTATSSQTNYQRLVVFQASGERKLYYGKSGSTTNIAFTYTQGSDSAYRGYYSADTSTSMTKFELHSNSVANSNATVVRVLIDESEAPGEVTAVGTVNDNGTQYTRWGYKAPTSVDDSFAVSMLWNGHGQGGTGLDTCVDPSNSFASDGTISTNCGTGTFRAPNIMNFDTFAGAAVTTIMGQTLNQFVSNVGEADVVSFDDSDIENASLVD